MPHEFLSQHIQPVDRLGVSQRRLVVSMPRPLRFQPELWSVFFVTSRCIHNRFLLRPSSTTNALLIGVMAKAVKRFDVKLFGLCFMSNHYHLLLSSKDAASLHVNSSGIYFAYSCGIYSSTLAVLPRKTETDRPVVIAAPSAVPVPCIHVGVSVTPFAAADDYAIIVSPYSPRATVCWSPVIIIVPPIL